MVRVVSCHHFLSQDVFLSENEPVAFCGAQGKLLVATTQHAVNVHDLDSRGNVLHTFPTVDIVKQIIFCESGNYVATIEHKASWHRSIVTYVRIYFKWWIDVNGQPLKVRIAGSAPISCDSQSWNKLFEMVELPLEKTALCIACCNQTSALAVSLGAVISVFCHSTKIHEESKQTFHDFDHFVDISVPIIVQELSICENYFSCMSGKAVHVFKIGCEKEDTSENQNCEVATNIEGKDPDLYDENFIEWRFESCTLTSSRDKNWDDHIRSKLHPKSFPINIHFHAIDKENEKFSSTEECEFYGPLLTVKGCPVEVRIDSKVFEMFPNASSYISAVTLLFRQFVSNENKCLTGLQLIPFYKSEELKGGFADPLNAAAFSSEKCFYSLPWPNLSASISKLRAIGCFFSTFQEGFLYDITNEIRLVSSYAYTSSLKGVVLETSLLHALTETGLETYTMHLPHSALNSIETVDGIKNVLPNYEDSICLMGLRPFLGVDHLVMSENYLILVSSLEDSVSNSEVDGGNKSTLYSLKKPVAVQVFSDLLEVAESHKTSSPSTYYHLLSEAHMILRAELFLKNFRDKEIETLFRKSCLLLADYFLFSDSAHRLNAIPYYHLSNLSPESVVQRILDYHHQAKHADILLPLIHYLNSVLFEERIFEFSQAQADAILCTYSEEAPDSLWKVILCSSLTGYKIDKVILMLKRRLTSKRHPLSPVSSAADTTALVQLLIQKRNFDAAQSMFLSLAKTDLVTVLSNVHNKLWDGKKLSSLGKFTMQVRPDAFVELLLNDVACKQIKVTTVLHVLQDESPDADLHSLPLLKDFLEAILSDKKMLSDVDSSVLVLLVKIYLKRLLESHNKNGATSNTFSGSVCSFAVLFGSRSAWLNEMPPFNGKGISRTCTLSQKCNKDKADGQEEMDCCCWSCNEDLLRLQSLLSYLGPSDEVKELVLDFLCSAKEKKFSWLSLDVMCSSEAQAIKILIGMAPRALLPYAKEIIKTDEKKWCMLFTLLHEHMKSLPEDHPLFEVYLETFHSVLAHLAETLKPIELLGLLPQEKDPIFVPYVKRCVDKHQANLLKDKIVSLGQEIKSMMLS